jgi:hypothetical protein
VPGKHSVPRQDIWIKLFYGHPGTRSRFEIAAVFRANQVDQELTRTRCAFRRRGGIDFVRREIYVLVGGSVQLYL